jgi:hypothetical protein
MTIQQSKGSPVLTRGNFASAKMSNSFFTPARYKAPLPRVIPGGKIGPGSFSQ